VDRAALRNLLDGNTLPARTLTRFRNRQGSKPSDCKRRCRHELSHSCCLFLEVRHQSFGPSQHQFRTRCLEWLDCFASGLRLQYMLASPSKYVPPRSLRPHPSWSNEDSQVADQSGLYIPEAPRPSTRLHRTTTHRRAVGRIAPRPFHITCKLLRRRRMARTKKVPRSLQRYGRPIDSYG